MNRKDYRRMMQVKKRNKMYAKATIFGALGLGVFSISTQVNAEEWRANTVSEIKEAIKSAENGIYIIKAGDTLSGISEATGVTIETLAKVNNIENIDLIYVGDKLVINTTDGKISLVDNNNTVKNEVPLTKEDKQGIKEVQKQGNTDVYSKNSSNSKNNNNNSVINTNTSNSNGNNSSNNGDNNGGGITKPINPINPVKPIEPTNPIKPVDPNKPEEDKKYFTQILVFQDVADRDLLFETLVLEVEELDYNPLTGISTGVVDLSTLDLPTGYELAGTQENVLTVYTSMGTSIVDIKKIEDIETPTNPEDGKELVNVLFYDIDSKENEDYEPIIVQKYINFEGKSEEGVNFGFVTISEADVPEGYELVGNPDLTQKVFESMMFARYDIKKIEDTNPVEPTTPETVDLEVHYFTGNDLVHTDKVTVELGKDGKGIVEANVPIGYEIVGEGEATATVTKDTQFISFEVKSTTPNSEKVTAEVIYNLIDIDGNVIEVLNQEPFEWEKGKEITIEANTKYGSYDLISEPVITQKVYQGTQFVFNYVDSSKPVEPTAPEETGKVNVAINFILVDQDGNFVETLQHMPFEWISGEELSYTADEYWGDAKLISEPTQTIVAQEGSVMTFTYQRDTSVDIPQWVTGLGEIPTTQADLADDSLTLGNVNYTFLTLAEADAWAEANGRAWYYYNGIDQENAWWNTWTVRMKNGEVRYSVHFNVYE